MASFAFLHTSLMAGLTNYWVLISTFALWQYFLFKEYEEKHPASHRYVIRKRKNILIAFLDG